MSPLVSAVTVTRDYNSSFNLARGLALSVEIVSLNLLIKRVAEGLIKKELHHCNKETAKNYSAYNTVSKEEIVVSANAAEYVKINE